MPKLLFISSTGGHLSELQKLSPLFTKYEYTLVTERTKTNRSLKNKYKHHLHYLAYGTKDHPLTYFFVVIYNIIKSLILYFIIRPDYIITTGAHTAVAMCYIGKLFGSRIIYIETFANIETKTLTGKLVYKIADKFIVQWPTMLKLYPKAIDGGWIY